MEWESIRFYHATQKGPQSKTYESFFSEIFHLILDHSCPQVTEIVESGTMDKEGLFATIMRVYPPKLCNFFLFNAKITFPDSQEASFPYQCMRFTCLPVDIRQELGKMDLCLSLSADGLKPLK